MNADRQMTPADRGIAAARQQVWDASYRDASYRGDWPADLVPPEDGCTCGERRVDWLMWCGPDGSPFVECQSCGREFIPGEAAR